jgi:hypothetical protein
MIAPPRERYAARLQELEALHHELTGGGRPGDGAVVVGLLLEAAGDLLRRRTALAVDAARVVQQLKVVAEAALQAWAGGLALDELAQKLARAADRAVEAAIPDDDDRGAALAQWATQDLQARDRLESALVALEALANAGRSDAGALVERLRREVSRVDARCRAGLCCLTALNEARRAEAALLDAEFRARAWWYAELSSIGDDLLVKVLGGEARGTLPPALEAASAVVAGPHSRRVGFDELFRLDLGLASLAEQEVIRRQAARDPELKLALAAMEAAEAALDEVDGAPASPTHAAAPERPAPPQLIEERDDFKVLVFRTRRSVQVVVQPRRPDRFAAAAVYRGDSADTPVESRPGEFGLHFDCGAPERAAGTSARVVVKLVSGQTHAVEVRL